jgi:hypothetical protein
MAKINLLNEKGNIRPKVRDSIKLQVGTMIRNSLSNLPFDSTQSSGTYVMEVGTVATTNEPIYATVTVGVSTIHPDVKAKNSNRKSSKTDSVELPELF